MTDEQSLKREIDWSTAQVADGTLTVDLTGEAPKAWAERVAHVLERLGRGEGITVKKRTLTMPGVTPGGEGDVRHLLESAVLQVNADLAPERPEAGGEEAVDEGSAADREMTDAFRAFGGGAPHDDADDA